MAPLCGRSLWGCAASALVLAVSAAPVLPLAAGAVEVRPDTPVWTRAFSAAITGSLLLAGAVAAAGFCIGLPLGVMAWLYRFPARGLLLPLQALPLVLPSFLPAIGWSNLTAARWFPGPLAPTGFCGASLVLGSQSVGLVVLATWAACQSLTASQTDAARLHGGEAAVWMLTARSAAPVAVLAALLAGILSISDSGAPLILGCRAVAKEIVTSFAALHDYDLAGRQCLVLAALVVVFAAPVTVLGLRRVAAAVLARQTKPAAPRFHRLLSPAALAGLVLASLVGVGIPTLGLCMPVLQNPMFGRAAQTAQATLAPTLVYSAGAAALAVPLGMVVAFATAKDARLRAAVLWGLLLLLTLPPALGALGVSRIASGSPWWLDWLTRGNVTVALVLGLRLLPIAAVVMMRAVGSLAPSWAEAARLHGIGSIRFFLRVQAPILAPAAAAAFLLVAVLAAADITTTHVLRPPGSDSLPMAIFTVMANSPEGLVASMCLMNLGGVISLACCAILVARWWTRRTE